MIYIVIAAIVILILLVVLIIHSYKTDNTIIEFHKKIDTSYEQINGEMHSRAKLVEQLINALEPMVRYDDDLEKRFKNLKKSLEKYYTSGTRGYQVDAHSEITKSLNEFTKLLDNINDEQLSDSIKSLIHEIQRSDERINFSKNIYNNLVQNYNLYISKFLNKRVAKMFKYGPIKKLGEKDEDK